MLIFTICDFELIFVDFWCVKFYIFLRFVILSWFYGFFGELNYARFLWFVNLSCFLSFKICSFFVNFGWFLSFKICSFLRFVNLGCFLGFKICSFLRFEIFWSVKKLIFYIFFAICNILGMKNTKWDEILWKVFQGAPLYTTKIPVF